MEESATPTPYHIPALLPQVLEGLEVSPGGTYVDVTYGGGGHTRAMLELMHGRGAVYAMDQDIEAIERAKPLPGLTLLHGNFRYMSNFLQYAGVEPGTADGILADLGVSFHHFDDPRRGFSFRWDGPLDMRMNPRAPITAARLIEEATEERLAELLRLYGELKSAKRMAAAIVRARSAAPITTVEALLQAVRPLIDPRQEKKELAQIFQALRIEVNGELGALTAFLQQAVQMLRPGGRLAVITYHSLEDRLVKNFMKTGNIEGRTQPDIFGRCQSPLRPCGSKPVVPDQAEIDANPRSRSAKLRVAQKNEE